MPRVSLFIPCTVDVLLPEVGEDAWTLLSRLGVNTVYHEEQTCCGQPLFNAGYRDHARQLAKHFIEIFGEDEAVVSPSGSCVCMVKHHYPELLADEPWWRARAVDLAGKVYELTQYIVDVLGRTNVGASFAGKVTYHESCHILRGLGISDQPRRLIEGVQGAQYVPLNNAQTCCGFGGEFSFQFPEISEAMVKDKVNSFLSSGAEVLVLSEPGCFLNINGYLHRHHPGKRVMHIASFLAGKAKEA
jgi:L-lactate dehydrogenase complex protein LldE